MTGSSYARELPGGIYVDQPILIIGEQDIEDAKIQTRLLHESPEPGGLLFGQREG